jgi:NAD(P) transhydrogenase subunit alpha
MDQDIIFLLYVFILAMFAGYEVITKVPPILHTPLMSGANAISGVCLIGAMMVTGPNEANLSTILGMIAVIMATINVVGGFMVTDRMLAMFKKE